MSKYSSEFKVRFVSKYLKGGISYNDLCTEFGIPCGGVVKIWVKQARAHGLDSLKVKYTKTDNSQTFKISVVEYVRTHQVSRARAAAHFGISPSQVNSWYRIDDLTGLRKLVNGYVDWFNNARISRTYIFRPSCVLNVDFSMANTIQ